MTANEREPKPSGGEQTLSVVVRLPRGGCLQSLDETLFSLSVQYWREVETIVVVEEGAGVTEGDVFELAGRQPWDDGARCRALSVAVRRGANVRAALANAGLRAAAGRFLAFLDNGEVVYQHGYATLIRQLAGGRSAVAVGGHRRAHVRPGAGHAFVVTKDSFPWRPARNFFRVERPPADALVIDRSRLGSLDLHFDETLQAREDEDFLARLFAACEPDLSRRHTPVSEYRTRLAGADRLMYEAARRAYLLTNAAPGLRAGLRRILFGARRGED